MEGERQLEDYFERHAKKGIVLSPTQLAKYARSKGIVVGEHDLRQMRQRFKASAFSSGYRKPRHHMTSSVQKYGVCMLDVAIFEKAHASSNSGCGAFMTAVEVVSQQLFALGMKDGKQASWEKAVTELAETKFHSMNVIVTDRDSAVKSQAFRDSIKERFGITWTHLRSRSKA
jgi:hypothetical protein